MSTMIEMMVGTTTATTTRTMTITMATKESEEKRAAQSIAAHKTDSSKMATLKNQP